MEDEFKQSDISFLRNVVAAHPVNFDKNSQVKNFKISRWSLSNYSAIEVVDMNNNLRTLDLFDAIDKYLKFMENELDKIARKLITSRYSTSAQKTNEWLVELERHLSTAGNKPC